jgi:hypothetical protein
MLMGMLSGIARDEASWRRVQHGPASAACMMSRSKARLFARRIARSG